MQKNNKANYNQLHSTIFFNGIEIRAMENGAVEIFADRPCVVKIEDLEEVLTSFLKTQNSTEVQNNNHYLESSYKLHEEPYRKAGLGGDLYPH
jgi:hypothetical protein